MNKKMEKCTLEFVQIQVSDQYIYALDKFGLIWMRNNKDPNSKWFYLNQEITADKIPYSNERRNFVRMTA
jgi:hypothetical protein